MELYCDEQHVIFAWKESLLFNLLDILWSHHCMMLVVAVLGHSPIEYVSTSVTGLSLLR
jgi:hypothetical protein